MNMKRIELEDIFDQKDRKGFKLYNLEINKLFSLNIKKRAINFYNEVNRKYKNSNQIVWPSSKYETIIDTLIVNEMKDLGFSRNLILKVIDQMLIPNIGNEFEIGMVLSFLYGTGAISESEMNERDAMTKNLNNSLFEEYNNGAIGIVIYDNKILFISGESSPDTYDIFGVSGKNGDDLKNKLIDLIIEKTGKRVKSVSFWAYGKINMDYGECTHDFYIIELEDNSLINNNMKFYGLNDINSDKAYFIENNKICFVGGFYCLFKKFIKENNIDLKEAEDFSYIVKTQGEINNQKRGKKLKCDAYGVIMDNNLKKMLLEKNVVENKYGFVLGEGYQQIEYKDPEIVYYDLLMVSGEDADKARKKLIEKIIEMTGKKIKSIVLHVHLCGFPGIGFELNDFYKLKLDNDSVASNNLKWYDPNEPNGMIYGDKLQRYEAITRKYDD